MFKSYLYQITLTLLLILLFFQNQTEAQRTFGLLMHADYNLYSRYEMPTDISAEFRSSGQVLNVLPSIGLDLMIMSKGPFSVGFGGRAAYLPFALDTEQYNGLGAASLSAIGSVYLAFYRIGSYVQLGGGVQWNRVELYDRKRLGTNQLFRTYVVEFSWCFADDYYIYDPIGIFVRVGMAPNQAESLDVGVRFPITLF